MDDQTTDGLVAPEVNQAYDLIKQGPMGAIAEPLQRLSTGAAREQFTAAKAQQDREQAGLAQKTTAAQNLAGTEHQAAQAFDKLPPQPKYDVTPDTHEGLMGLAAILPLAGILLGTKGSTSGANALNAMTGVLKGYQEGNQQRIQFEKEKYEKSMDEWRNHYKMVQDGFQRAIEMAKTDYQAGIAKAEETAHRAGSPELLASIRANGIVDTMNKLQESNKYVMQAQAKVNAMAGGLGPNAALAGIFGPELAGRTPPKEAEKLLGSLTSIKSTLNLIEKAKDPDIKFGEFGAFGENLKSKIRRNLGSDDNAELSKQGVERSIDEAASESGLNSNDKNLVFYKEAVFTALELERQARGGSILPVAVMKTLGPLLDPKSTTKETYVEILRRRAEDVARSTGLSQPQIDAALPQVGNVQIKLPGSGVATPQPKTPSSNLDKAKAAIAAGAPREKVIERLRAAGEDVSGL
jgi:hypothetical protein